MVESFVKWGKGPDASKEAVELYGKEHQLNVCIEEMSELIKEICKDKRGNGNLKNIAEEMADVKICFEQLLIIYGNTEEVEDWYDKKKRRLSGRVHRDRLLPKKERDRYTN